MLVGADRMQIDARPKGGGPQGDGLLRNCRCIPGAEPRVARVDGQLLPRLEILEHDHAGLGQLELVRVDDPQRKDFVASPELRRRRRDEAVARAGGDAALDAALIQQLLATRNDRPLRIIE